MQISLKQYKKDLKYSYASGVFATLELLTNKPDKVVRVFLNSRGEDNHGLDEIRKICQENNIPIETADGLVVKLSHSENCYAVGVFNKYSSKVEENKNHVVLVNPSDMGNMGTIIRTMVGFGITNLAIIKPAADIFDPKVIRSSTGSFFQLNFEFFNSFEEYQKKFSQQKIYTFMLGGKEKLNQIKFEKPFSLVFGNEGSGLPTEYLKYGTAVTIPHSKKIDSLNLSIAAAIAIYHGCKDDF